jgi:lysophospholipase L1-like esterase
VALAVALVLAFFLASSCDEFPDEAFYGVLRKSMGKSGARLVGAVFLLLTLLTAVVSLTVFSRFVQITALPRTPQIVIPTILIVIAALSLSGEMTDITIYMPKNEILDNIYIGIDDDADIEAPTPYVNEKPVIFYGSSITEGGCAGRVGNAYTAALSRKLNMDYINFGFSGSAKGEPGMAEFIASVPMSIFVMDYDYNAPDAEHLQKTHEPFFRIIREKNPELPIVMLSNPNYKLNPEKNEKRLAVIRKTYENAKERGDENVYLISGENFYGDDDIYACTVDLVHPNDHGFALMAKEIRKTLEPLLLSVVQNEKGSQK